MEPLPPSFDRRNRFVSLTIALVVLLALVAISSRSGFGGSGAAGPNNTYISYAMSVFLIVFVLMIPLAIYAYVIRTKEMASIGRPPAKRFWRMMIGLGILGLGLFLRHWLQTHQLFFGHNGLFHRDSKLTGTGHLKNQHGKPQQPHFEYSVLWVALALGVLVLVAWVVQRARREPVVHPAFSFGEQDELVVAISDAIDDLEREPDPRRAVIAAYARMERELGRQGLPRRPSETSVEYMRRALHERTARSASVEALTGLFERAKFSRHEITPAMKQEAIDALVDIREGITA